MCKLNCERTKQLQRRLASRRRAGQVRHIHCFALWLQQSIARRRSRIEKRTVSTLSTDVGTTMQKMWELLTRFGCRKCARRTNVALQNTRCCCNLNLLHRHQKGYTHADASSQVHDELTLCTEFHDYLNTGVLVSIITTPSQLHCKMRSPMARLWSEPKTRTE